MPAEVDERVLDAWCARHLGASVARRTFQTGHLSAVYGLRLVDGREVVVKVRPAQARLEACTRVQRALWQTGFACPQPLAGPFPLGGYAASAESALPGGEPPSPEAAPERFARLLADFVTRAQDLPIEPALRPAPAWICWYHRENGVWPVPDDRDADLNAERSSAAAWVDELGAAVRERLEAIRDAPGVIGHGDWDGRNVKFHDGRPLAVHDWDSVIDEPEVVVAGQAAAMFEAGPTGFGASVERTEAFLEHYQRARGRGFDPEEIRLCWAAGLWVRAFNAKKYQLDHIDALEREEAEVRMRHAGI